MSDTCGDGFGALAGLGSRKAAHIEDNINLRFQFPVSLLVEILGVDAGIIESDKGIIVFDSWLIPIGHRRVWFVCSPIITAVMLHNDNFFLI
jgi:hypothetical protein